ncbi:MAG TPA: response regulator transcription factor [Acetobacteraceae bacterium]|jgi:DNA-binding response OmpR family regulator|nr:response regulator transcription factor [Acetobacteraceae bacterium]
MRILISDRDAQFAAKLAALFPDADYRVQILLADGEMPRALDGDAFDLMILELPPEGACQSALLRDLVRGGPFILVVPGSDDAARVQALELGADDVIGREASPSEILARTRAVIRRRAQSAASREGTTGWRFVPARRDLIRPDGTRVALTAAEFALLDVLVRNQGAAIDRETLFAEVFRRPFQPMDRAIDTLVAKLRAKLGDRPRTPDVIRTVRPIGYMFVGFPPPAAPQAVPAAAVQ